MIILMFSCYEIVFPQYIFSFSYIQFCIDYYLINPVLLFVSGSILFCNVLCINCLILFVLINKISEHNNEKTAFSENMIDSYIVNGL